MEQYLPRALSFGERLRLEDQWISQFKGSVHRIDQDPLDRLSWLEQRRKGVGASDVPKLFGVGYMASPRQVWKSKMEAASIEAPKEWYGSETSPLSDSPSEAADTGSVKEDFIAWQFERRTALKTLQPASMFKGSSVLQISIDRLILGEKAILEIKNVNEYDRDLWADGKVPEKVYLQVQAQLSAFPEGEGVKAYVIAEIGGNSYCIRTIERSKEAIDRITRVVDKFWEDFVLKAVEPPAMIPDDVKEVAEIGSISKTPIALSLREIKALERLLYIKETQSELDEERKALESYFRDRLKKNVEAVGVDAYIRYTPRLDYELDHKALREADPGLYRKYQDFVFNEKSFMEECPEIYQKYSSPLVRRTLTTGRIKKKK